MKTKARTSPRRIPQQRRSRVTVDAIVEAAAHLLAARGWHASTTNHIAERAGVSIGSLYKYFPNKPSILAEVARRRIAGEVSGIAATMQAHADDPRAMLGAMVAATVERYAVNAALDTALMEHLGPMEVARFLRDAEGAVVEMTEGYLARHRARLRARDGEEGGRWPSWWCTRCAACWWPPPRAARRCCARSHFARRWRGCWSASFSPDSFCQAYFDRHGCSRSPASAGRPSCRSGRRPIPTDGEVQDDEGPIIEDPVVAFGVGGVLVVERVVDVPADRVGLPLDGEDVESSENLALP